MYGSLQENTYKYKCQGYHPSSMKKGIIKGFADRARALCDPGYVEEELKNI
jgi:hypothetical protein